MKTDLITIGGAMSGGGGSGGSSTPTDSPNTLRSKSYVEIIEAWAWGEIEGFPAGVDPLTRVYLDGVPVKAGGHTNYPGVTFDYRTGTQDQTYIQGTNGDAVGSPVSVNTVVSHGIPIIRTITDPDVDAVDVILTFSSGLLNVNASNGDRGPIAVQVLFEVSVNGGYSWSTVGFGGRENVSGKTESAYQRTFHINLRAVAASAPSYEIRVTRVSADPTGYQQSAFLWDSYVQLSYLKLRRPNIAHCRLVFDSAYFSQIPTRSYLLRGWRIQVPNATVYDPIARTYTGADWDGTFVKSWNRNPAWFLYAVLTTPGAGLGADINPAYQDKWVIYQIAKRCDEIISDGLGGTEHRYSIDYFFQAHTNAIDLIQAIAGIFDAQSLWDGKSVYVTQDAPKSVSALFMPANVVGGRFMYAGSSRQTRYTAALIQYSDPTNLYQLSTEYVEDLAGIARYGYRPKTEAAVGVISRGQAHRHGKRLLITGRRETDTVTFSVGLTGISSKPGDIIRIADPLRATGQRYGGRISSGSSAASINLDAPVTLAAGTSYRLAIIGADGNVADSAITNSAGTYSAITVSPAFPAAPAQELEFIVYNPTADNQLFRILRITDNQDLNSGFYTVVATQYDAGKFSEIDSMAQLPALPNNPYIQSGVIPPSGLAANEGTYTGLEGLRRFIDISWSASTDSMLRGYYLVYELNGAVVFEREIGNVVQYRIDNPIQGNYTIIVKAINAIGLASVSLSITYTLGVLYDVTVVHITGLELPSGTADFTGTDALFSWSTDAASVLGSSFANGQGGQSPWFRDYEIKIYDTSTTPVLLRTEYVTENYYSYTFQKNVADGGPRRTFTAHVRARDYYGNFSNESTLTATNPPPTDYNAVTLTSGINQIFISYVPPSDPDYTATAIYASQTSGFTPGPANLKNTTTNRVTVIPAAVGDWYIKLQGIDEFGQTGTVYSTEAHVTVTTADITTLVDSLLSTPARESDFVIEAWRFFVTLTDGTTPQTVFGIGNVNGVTQVGIRGDVVLDGTFNAQAIQAHSITVDKLLVTNLSAINEDAGTITAGVLRSFDGTMVVDLNNKNIMIAGAGGHDADDYILMEAGNVTFHKWIPATSTHQAAQSLQNIEKGTANSGDTITLSRYYSTAPTIIVQPLSTPIYNKDYSNQNQRLEVDAINQTLSSGGVVTFEALSQLVLEYNNTIIPLSEDHTGSSDTYTSSVYTTPPNTTQIAVVPAVSSVKGTGSGSAYYSRQCTLELFYKVHGSSSAYSSSGTNTFSFPNDLTTVIDYQVIFSPTIAADTYDFYVVFTFANQSGNPTFTSGTPSYTYNTVNQYLGADSAIADATAYPYTGLKSIDLTFPSYSAPGGSTIVSTVYTIAYQYYLLTNSGASTTEQIKSNSGAVLQSQGPSVGSNGNPFMTGIGATYNYSGSGYSPSQSGALQVYMSNPAYGAAKGKVIASGTFAAITYKTPVGNSTTPINNIAMNKLIVELSGTTVLNPGAIKWVAIG